MKKIQIHELKFSDVSFGYNNNDLIFENLNFEFTKPHPVVLQGPLGSGKRTLLKLILGLYPILGGSYLINGKRVDNMSFKEFDLYRPSIGHSFESGGLLNNRTIFENLTLPIEYHNFIPKNEINDYVDKFLCHFHLEDSKNIRPAFVSSGVRKVVNLIRAFLLRPEFIILDGPTQGLAPEYQTQLVELIHLHLTEYNLKYLVVTSDDDHFIEKIGGRIYLVKRSEVIHELKRAA